MISLNVALIRLSVVSAMIIGCTEAFFSGNSIDRSNTASAFYSSASPSIAHGKRIAFAFPHQTRSTELNTFLDENVDELPEWATRNLSPPTTSEDEVDVLYLGSDDFVSMELENEESEPNTFCATIVYQDPNMEPQFLVEPRIGTIAPNGGTLEVTAKPIVDEDDVATSKEFPICWLVISTEKGEAWYYKLEGSADTSSEGDM